MKLTMIPRTLCAVIGGKRHEVNYVDRGGPDPTVATICGIVLPLTRVWVMTNSVRRVTCQRCNPCAKGE